MEFEEFDDTLLENNTRAVSVLAQSYINDPGKIFDISKSMDKGPREIHYEKMTQLEALDIILVLDGGTIELNRTTSADIGEIILALNKDMEKCVSNPIEKLILFHSTDDTKISFTPLSSYYYVLKHKITDIVTYLRQSTVVRSIVYWKGKWLTNALGAIYHFSTSHIIINNADTYARYKCIDVCGNDFLYFVGYGEKIHNMVLCDNRILYQLEKSESGGNIIAIDGDIVQKYSPVQLQIGEYVDDTEDTIYFASIMIEDMPPFNKIVVNSNELGILSSTTDFSVELPLPHHALIYLRYVQWDEVLRFIGMDDFKLYMEMTNDVRLIINSIPYMFDSIEEAISALESSQLEKHPHYARLISTITEKLDQLRERLPILPPFKQ